MPKVTIDKETFKALASDVRLEILKSLDGRKMNLTEIARKMGMSKTTVLEHLNKLVQANLVKKIEREGHKWTYYKLSWKGASLLHPDNTKIVITFCLSFFLLLAGISQIIIYGKGFYIAPSNDTLLAEYWNEYLKDNRTYSSLPSEVNETKIKSLAKNHTILNMDPENVMISDYRSEGFSHNNTAGTYLKIFYQDPFYLYSGLILVISSLCLLVFSFKRLWNRKQAI